jgi:hypothetical protein
MSASNGLAWASLLPDLVTHEICPRLHSAAFLALCFTCREEYERGRCSARWQRYPTTLARLMSQNADCDDAFDEDDARLVEWWVERLVPRTSLLYVQFLFVLNAERRARFLDAIVTKPSLHEQAAVWHDRGVYLPEKRTAMTTMTRLDRVASRRLFDHQRQVPIFEECGYADAVIRLYATEAVLHAAWQALYFRLRAVLAFVFIDDSVAKQEDRERARSMHLPWICLARFPGSSPMGMAVASFMPLSVNTVFDNDTMQLSQLALNMSVDTVAIQRRLLAPLL